MKTHDLIIIGASAAGLMCAIEAAKRGRQVRVIDHANKPGKKILMAGGGHCNFTNLDINPSCYISHNPHFCKSALSRYTQWDFIKLVESHEIPYHEKTLGQLFCVDKSKAILTMLLSECAKYSVKIQLSCEPTIPKKLDNGYFKTITNSGEFISESVVIATGGLSIPTMGASPFGYKVAAHFDLPVFPTRAGLVPFTLQDKDKATLAPLSGIAIDTVVSNDRAEFVESSLFTHRGLSGPAMLQISSYWEPGEALTVNLLPTLELTTALPEKRQAQPNKLVKSILAEHLPKRMVAAILPESWHERTLKSLTEQDYQALSTLFHHWTIKPNGTEGYRTAEVTLGGVDCDHLSSKTMEASAVKGLYFIGEVVDVTGWLGGYNFQWAWSSGWAAGQVA